MTSIGFAFGVLGHLVVSLYRLHEWLGASHSDGVDNAIGFFTLIFIYLAFLLAFIVAIVFALRIILRVIDLVERRLERVR